MFRDVLYRIMDSKGITESDFYKLLSYHCITDEEIFVISHLINNNRNANIFFTKIIGDIEVRVRLFEIEVVYDIVKSNTGKTLTTMSVSFDKETLFVEYSDCRLEIGLDLFDYPEMDKTNVLFMRMQLLNEILTRYYSRMLYSIYLERRRHRWD